MPRADPLHGGGAPLPGLSAWLDDLDRAQATAEEDYPGSVVQRLVYVRTPIPSGHGVPQLGFRPVAVRLRKDGHFSDGGRTYGIGAALSGTPAKFLRPSDLRILRAATLLRRTHWADAAHSLAADGRAAILQEMLATGRGRWGEVNRPALAAGPARPDGERPAGRRRAPSRPARPSSTGWRRCWSSCSRRGGGSWCSRSSRRCWP